MSEAEDVMNAEEAGLDEVVNVDLAVVPVSGTEVVLAAMFDAVFLGEAEPAVVFKEGRGRFEHTDSLDVVAVDDGELVLGDVAVVDTAELLVSEDKAEELLSLVERNEAGFGRGRGVHALAEVVDWTVEDGLVVEVGLSFNVGLLVDSVVDVWLSLAVVDLSSSSSSSLSLSSPSPPLTSSSTLL